MLRMQKQFININKEAKLIHKSIQERFSKLKTVIPAPVIDIFNEHYFKEMQFGLSNRKLKHVQCSICFKDT